MTTIDERFSKLLHTKLRKYHGFTEIQENNEVYFIMTFIGTETLLKGHDLKFGNRAYVSPTFSRKGRYKPLNRREKVSIALTINKCLDHAEFDVVESA